MKRQIKRILALFLACIAIAGCFVGCSAKGKALMELDGTEMSVNTVMLFLSRMKATLASSYNYGYDADDEKFWDTVMDTSTGKTYNRFYTDMVLENAKIYLAADHVFDTEGLKLSKDVTEEVDKRMEDLLYAKADGSKTTFNALLSPYGANYTVLRDAYLLEEKVEALGNHLFGADASLVSDDIKQDFYEKTYVRFKHIFFYTSTVRYHKDANGDEIYFLNDKKIAYDETAMKKTDANGDQIYIWIDEDGRERIAYDKEAGKRAPVTDSNGAVVKDKLPTDELIAISDTVQIIMEEKAREKEYILFDSLVEDYGEDVGMQTYKNGYYLTANSGYEIEEVSEAVFDMADGEIRRVESSEGIHIVMRYALDDGAYANEENKDFFASFPKSLKNYLLAEYLDAYLDDIVVDEKLFATIDIKSIEANYYY